MFGKKIAVDKVKINENFLDDIYSEAKIGGWEMDILNGGKVKWTKGTYDIVDLDYDKPIPSFKEHLQWYLPEYREMVEKKMDALVNDHKPMMFEAEFKTVKGERKWVRVTGRAVVENEKLEKLVGTFQDISDIKTAQENIVLSRQKLSWHLENTPIVHIEWDLDFKVTEWNRAATVVFGYNKEEALGKQAIDLIIPDAAKEHVDETWKNLLKQKGGLRSSNQNTTKSGKLISCDWFNTPLLNKDGKLVGVASLVQDITEKEKIETEKTKLIDSLSQAETIASLGYFERNWQTGEGYWSDGFYKLLGINQKNKKYSHSDFIEHIHVEDRARIADYIESSIAKKIPMDMEFKLLTVDKKVKNIHGVAKNTYIEGKPLLTQGVFQDVTASNAAKIALNERMKELKAIYDISSILYNDIIDFDETFTKIAEIIKKAYQFPEIISVNVKIDNTGYKTKDFKDSKWSQSEFIKVGRKERGEIKACYSREKEFLLDEKKMIQEVASLIARALDKKQVDEKFKQKFNELEKFHRLTVARELKMIKLKKKLKELEKGDEDEK